MSGRHSNALALPGESADLERVFSIDRSQPKERPEYWPEVQPEYRPKYLCPASGSFLPVSSTTSMGESTLTLDGAEGAAEGAAKRAAPRGCNVPS